MYAYCISTNTIDFNLISQETGVHFWICQTSLDNITYSNFNFSGFLTNPTHNVTNVPYGVWFKMIHLVKRSPCNEWSVTIRHDGPSGKKIKSNKIVLNEKEIELLIESFNIYNYNKINQFL